MTCCCIHSLAIQSIQQVVGTMCFGVIDKLQQRPLISDLKWLNHTMYSMQVPRWEYFIGDRPLAPLVDQFNRRRCIAQLAAIEDQADAGEVVVSKEVLALIQDEWEVEMLPDEVARTIMPLQPFATPARPISQPLRPAARASDAGDRPSSQHLASTGG